MQQRTHDQISVMRALADVRPGSHLPASEKQVFSLVLPLSRFFGNDRTMRLAVLRTIFPWGPLKEVESTKDLSVAEAGVLIEELLEDGPGTPIRPEARVFLKEVQQHVETD